MVINDTYDNRYSPNCKLHHHHHHHHLSTEEQVTIVLVRSTWSKAMAVTHLQNLQVIKCDKLMTSQHGALSELGKYSPKNLFGRKFSVVSARHIQSSTRLSSRVRSLSPSSRCVSVLWRGSCLDVYKFVIWQIQFMT